MKKLFVSLLAIAGMVACTNDEVVSVQQGNPIAFDTFVENTTRVGYDSSNLPEGFNVWAFIETENGNRSTILDAEPVTRQGDQYVYGNTQYWVPGNTYYFAALAPMDSQNVTNLVLATGDAAKKGLGTFDFNNDNGTEDLIYAVNMVEASETTSKVTFTFKHLLSKVKFSFTNTFDNANYSIEVRDITMTVPMSGNVNLAADKVVWTPGSTLIGLDFDETGIIAQSGVAHSAERLTIPAGATQEYGVTFTVDLFVGNGADKVLAKTYEKSSTISGIELEAGKAYNFAAAINAESLALSEVIFDASVDGWVEDGNDVKEAELRAAAILGGEVTLTENIALTESLTIVEGANVVINLNGKTITGTSVKGEGAIIENNGTLTLVGGTIKNTETNGDAVINNNGELVLDGVKIEGAPIGTTNYPNYAVYTSGKLTVENETQIISDRGALSMKNGADVTINGGEFIVTDAVGTRTLTAHVIYAYGSNSKLTINGGNFAMNIANGGGTSVICPAGATIKVYGGNFFHAPTTDVQSGCFQNYMGYGAPVDVYGGVFNDDTVTKSGNLAAGYKAVQSGDKYMVVKEDVGGVATDNATLDTAITNAQDGDTIVLNAGEYVIPDSAVGKTITFVGTGAPEDTLITAQNDGAAEGNCDYSLRGSKATFENVTITTTGTYFPGYAGCQGTYKNCIINGVFTLYDSSSFEDCTFNIVGDLYNVWTWGAAEATFTNCTFNCDGKAMLLYGQANTKLTMNNCVFNDNGDDTVTGKAAIEIGNDYNTSYELTVNNATVNGFAINPNGFVTGTTLWANKNSMPADKLKVTVDGKNAYNYVAAANDTQSFTDAINNGATEVALSNGNYTMPEPDLRGKTLTISGTKDVVIDATAVDARDQFVTDASLSFEGVTINFGNANYMGFANTASLTYKNCHINGLQFLFGENVEFENCTFNSNGAEHSVWTYGAKNVSFTKCDFTYGDRCVNCYSENGVKQTVNFTKCTFTTANTASEGAVEINSCYFSVGIEVNMDGCTAPAYGHMAYVSPWDSTNGAKTTINIK